jgi:hypothetical protein
VGYGRPGQIYNQHTREQLNIFIIEKDCNLSKELTGSHGMNGETLMPRNILYILRRKYEEDM